MLEDEQAELHRSQAVAANNSVWELLGDDSPDVTELLSRAYAASYHWERAARRGPENAARAAWLLSRCHVVLGNGDLALHHADECAAVVDCGDGGPRRLRSRSCVAAVVRTRGTSMSVVLVNSPAMMSRTSSRETRQSAASACSFAAR